MSLYIYIYIYIYTHTQTHQSPWPCLQRDFPGVVQWLRICASAAEGMDTIPGQRGKDLHAVLYVQKRKRKMTQMNILVRQKQTHRHTEQTYGCQGGTEGLAVWG